MIAVVTGASRGLGRTVAQVLAEDGWRLVITARDEAALEGAARELRDVGAREVRPVAGDVTDPRHRKHLVQRVGDRLDLLVHNASALGPSPLPPLLEASDEELRAVLETNLVAPLALTRALHPALRAARGRLVAITSDAAHGGYPGWGVYGASKAALELATRTLAAELTGIAVTLVDPGDLRTAMHQAAFPGEDIGDRPEPSVTVPFWRWWLEQPAEQLHGRRFEAQSELWETREATA